MTVRPLQSDGTSEEEAGPLEETLLERAVQLYHELRLVKRPPESAPGAERKSIRWLQEEALRLGRDLDPRWVPWLQRAFLEVEGDVAEVSARRRYARRSPPSAAVSRR